MTQGRSLRRLLEHAQRLTGMASAAEILAASCREMAVLTGADRALASCVLPGQAWETGCHIDGDGHELDGAARSALFALHRRVLLAGGKPVEVTRDREGEAIFAGLGCKSDVRDLYAVPIIHRTRRVWGSVVLIAAGSLDLSAEGVEELARLATVALENAQRLAFARRDQDRLLLLAEATNDALYDWDFDTRDFWWGGGILKLLGSDSDPVEHTSRWKLERVHEDDVERVRNAFEEARDSKAMTWTAEYRFRRQDGTYITVEDRGYFLRDVAGRAYRVIGSIHDITAMKTLLEREQQARATAESASRAKDEFLAMLGHELRNPLAPIVTGLDVMRMRGVPGLERELTVLQRQAQHLIRLVDDLLDISRITHGKIQLRKERLEVASVIASAIETAGPLIQSRRHRLETNVPMSGMLVDADRARITQALANLLNNAAKYTEPGGRIAISASRTGPQIEIRVRDNGVGIAPDMLPHVFRMFTQERQSLDRAQGGLGLGLSIVHSLVGLHGGSVSATSAGRGHGSEFTIRLPVAIADARHEHASSEPKSTHRLITGRKIMVVDDNADAADLLSMALESMGNVTRIAHDAGAALAVAEEFAPDLAVLDIGLPVVDGYELARRLRACHQHRVRLIALTGYGQESDKERAVQAGFDAHLVKPIELDTLKAVIENLTGN